MHQTFSVVAANSKSCLSSTTNNQCSEKIWTAQAAVFYGTKLAHRSWGRLSMLAIWSARVRRRTSMSCRRSASWSVLWRQYATSPVREFMFWIFFRASTQRLVRTQFSIGDTVVALRYIKHRTMKLGLCCSGI